MNDKKIHNIIGLPNYNPIVGLKSYREGISRGSANFGENVSSLDDAGFVNLGGQQVITTDNFEWAPSGKGLYQRGFSSVNTDYFAAGLKAIDGAKVVSLTGVMRGVLANGSEFGYCYGANVDGWGFNQIRGNIISLLRFSSGIGAFRIRGGNGDIQYSVSSLDEDISLTSTQMNALFAGDVRVSSSGGAGSYSISFTSLAGGGSYSWSAMAPMAINAGPYSGPAGKSFSGAGQRWGSLSFEGSSSTGGGVNGTITKGLPKIVGVTKYHQVIGLRKTIPEPMIYNMEVFTESGTWDWNAAGQPETVDVLVIAGGGGGGGHANNDGVGGGGAGGFIWEEAFHVSDNVSIIIGNGGSGSSGGGSDSSGQPGGNSEFGILVAVGGGRGSGFFSANLGNGGDGGSGGGATGSTASGIGTGGNAVTNQGNVGGDGFRSDTVISSRAGGGGGGAGNQGASGAPGAGGDGGAGIDMSDIFGTDIGDDGWFSGGGGGSSHVVQGSGGKGGGGNANSGSPGQDAMNNTGGGGGAGRVSGNGGGNGGSGIVIVRWIV